MVSTKIISSKYDVDSIINGVNTIISDCDGVIWMNKQPIEGAADFFKKMRSMGKRIIFATNNSTKSRQSLLNELNKFGFEATLDEVMVPSFVTAITLKRSSFTGKVFCLGSSFLRADIESAGFTVVPSSRDADEDLEEVKLFKDNAIDYASITYESDVSAVIIGMPQKISTIKLIKACTYISKVSPDLVICTNTDFSFPGPNGLIIPITGSYVEFFEKATKRKIICIGKPSRTFFDCIKIIHPTVDPSRTLVIGDTCHTDIAFGYNNGVKYTLLVGTGIHNLDDVEKFALDGLNHFIPSHFVSSLKAFIPFLSD